MLVVGPLKVFAREAAKINNFYRNATSVVDLFLSIYFSRSFFALFNISSISRSIIIIIVIVLSYKKINFAKLTCDV